MESIPVPAHPNQGAANTKSDRECQLGIAVGKRGIGKTYQTLQTIKQYVGGYGSQSVPRRVLIMDVNDEFGDPSNGSIKPLALQDVKRFSHNPHIEARRIMPYNPNGKKMTLTDICNALFYVLENFRGGLLLIEDINKYLSHNFPKDVVGAICTNRHGDLDIIMHYQHVGKVPTTVWENVNWIRFHKNNQAIGRHAPKFEDNSEILALAEQMVDQEYGSGNTRFFVTCNIDNRKIYGTFNAGQARKAVENYLLENRRELEREAKRINLDGSPVYKSFSDASKAKVASLMNEYFEFRAQTSQPKTAEKWSPRKPIFPD